MKMSKLVVPSIVIVFGLLSIKVNAFEVAPYASIKATWVHLENYVNQWDSTSGELSTIADRRFSDAVIGLKASLGIEMITDTEIAKAIRTEFEYGYNGPSENSGSFDYKISGFSIPTDFSLKSTIETFMLNVYYDVETCTKLTPYIGAGIGLADIKETAFVNNQYAKETASDSYKSLALNIGVGAAYEITPSIAFDLGLRLSKLGGRKNKTTNAYAERKYISYEALAGLRYTF